ncbi:MAG TPA: SDR family oxidoreductase [Candidatus Kapabacteria bacterium]|nr:SDR family oxidoreductase [Candidatus Kapabacteria bacterium]
MGKQSVRLMLVGADGGLGSVVRDIVGNETDWALIQVGRRTVHREGVEEEFDSASRAAWRSLFDSPDWRPTVVVNAAAMTNVDACETARPEAWRSNVTLVENIAAECKRHACKLIQISSDYIFDGAAGPYGEHATPNPINYYGKTKLAAENACIGAEINHAIIRTMWLYGEGRRGKPSFVSWLVDTLSARKTASVVTDEIGNPTLYDDVAYGIIKIIERDYSGTLNIAGPDLVSRWEFAQTVARIYNLDAGLLNPVQSGDLKRAARRPLRSGLISFHVQTLLGLRLTSLADGLGTCRVIELRMAR